jgi:acyl-CoA synthetase (AMP-forming)/AMP-acid ligase II
VPDRVVGEIVVSGPSVMQGYYRRPDDTDAALRGGWLHTGDLGYLADGELFITGRIKDVIIRNGRNYYPADIEAAIAGLAGVLRGGVAAFGVNDGPTERVVVAVETRFRDDAERAGLARAVRERCQEAFLFGPDETVLLGAGGIPRTTSGKVRRAECRRRYLAQSLVTGRTPVPPARPRTTAAADPS